MFQIYFHVIAPKIYIHCMIVLSRQMHKDGWWRWWCHSWRGALVLKQAYDCLEEEVMPIGHLYDVKNLDLSVFQV